MIGKRVDLVVVCVGGAAELEFRMVFSSKTPRDAKVGGLLQRGVSGRKNVKGRKELRPMRR